MYFKALGYFPIKLTKGKYKIQMKYLTDACVSYKPSTDWQNISLIVLLWPTSQTYFVQLCGGGVAMFALTRKVV